MTFRIVPVVVAAIVALPAFMQSQQTQQTHVLRGGVDLVRVDVSVLDSSGAPVEGLTREAFTLRENARGR